MARDTEDSRGFNYFRRVGSRDRHIVRMGSEKPFQKTGNSAAGFGSNDMYIIR
jgi:hypothetical protein